MKSSSKTSTMNIENVKAKKQFSSNKRAFSEVEEEPEEFLTPVKNTEMPKLIEKKKEMTYSEKKKEKQKVKKAQADLETYIHQIQVQDYYQQYPVKRIAFNSNQSLLAVARLNSEIEIWNTAFAAKNWKLVSKIPAQSQTTVETIAWIGDRLFTAGLHGVVTEWDLNTRLPKQQSSTSYGGAIYGIAIHGKTIAVANEDGKVRIFDADDLKLLKQTFGPSTAEQQPAHIKGDLKSRRLMAITFDSQGKHIFCCGPTGIYCFEMPSGSLKYRIVHSTLCMSLYYVKKGKYLVVGDAQGNTMFCDAVFGTIQSKFKQHVSYVLQITGTANDKYIFSTGADSRVSLFQFSNNRWMHTRSHRPSEHDIYGLAVFKDKYIVTGSLDSRLNLMDIKSFHQWDQSLISYPIVTDQRIGRAATILDGQRRLLFTFDNRNMITIAELPSTVYEKKDSSKRRKRTKDNIYHFEDHILAQLTVKSNAGWNVSSFDVSEDGTRVCCSGADFVVLFELQYTIDELDVLRLQVTSKTNLSNNSDLKAGLYCSFIDNNTICVVTRSSTTIQVFDVKKKNLNAVYELQPEYGHVTALAIVLNKYIAVTTNSGYLVVYDNTESLTPYWTVKQQVPSYRLGVLKFDSIYAISTDNKVNRCALKSKQVFTHEYKDNDFIGGMVGVVQGASSKYHPFGAWEISEVPTQRGEQNERSQFAQKRQPRLNILDLVELNDREFVKLCFDFDEYYLSLMGITYKKRFGT
jgi:WD40 repeat protein